MFTYYTQAVFKIGKKFSFLLVLFFTLSTISSYSQNCKAELMVREFQNPQSVYKEGAIFDLTLKNTSSVNASYSLSAVFLKESCASNNRKTSTSNVKLDVSFMNKDLTGLKEITLKGGQSYTFKVQVNTPKNTPYNSWSCIEIRANSNTCVGSGVNTILKVFVPDPSQG